MIELREVFVTIAPGQTRLFQVAQDLETGACWVIRSDDLWREGWLVLGKFARAHQAAALTMLEQDRPSEVFPDVAAAVHAWNEQRAAMPPQG